jgi:hypothetical protein
MIYFFGVVYLCSIDFEDTKITIFFYFRVPYYFFQFKTIFNFCFFL